MVTINHKQPEKLELIITNTLTHVALLTAATSLPLASH